jgi:hypothetical protein
LPATASVGGGRHDRHDPGLRLGQLDGSDRWHGNGHHHGSVLISALEAAWTDGGDPSLILCGSFVKRGIAAFSGANKYAGFYNPNQGKAQGAVIGGVDLYISDFGEHKIKLSRQQRARTLFCLDPEYVSMGVLRPIKMEELAKTGDANKRMLITEYCLIADNPDAHAKVQDLPTS